MIGAIICGILIMAFVAGCGFLALAAVISRKPAVQPKPGWTVRTVSTPMLADHGIPELFHVYDRQGYHACNTEDDHPFCYMTEKEAEAAARIGEQFTDLVLSAGEQS